MTPQFSDGILLDWAHLHNTTLTDQNTFQRSLDPVYFIQISYCNNDKHNNNTGRKGQKRIEKLIKKLKARQTR